MNTLYLSVHTLHVLLGAIWLGTAVAVSYFVMPAIQAAGPEGGKVVENLVRRGLPQFAASIAGLTVVTGFYLYWVLTGGFDPALSGSMKGRVYGAGAVLGLIAAILAGAVVGKSMKRAVAVMKEAAAETDAAKRAPLLEKAGQLRRKAAGGGRIVAVLLIVTIVLMVLGHYV